MWNSSNTRNVNAVLGFWKVAGKRPAAINCMSRLGALGQQHHLTPIPWTPDLSMIVITGFPCLSFFPSFELPKPSSNASWSTAAGYSPSGKSSLLPSCSSSSSKPACNYVSKWQIGHKKLHCAHFDLGMDPQRAQIASTPQLPATMMA